jgi:hypothetical protein
MRQLLTVAAQEQKAQVVTAVTQKEKDEEKPEVVPVAARKQEAEVVTAVAE